MIIASIDLLGGKVVQLRQGREKVLERNDHLSLARTFDKYGKIAVIDLDAALGKGENTQLVQEILKIAECRVGGGIRSVEKAHEMISFGAEKVIVGTKAFENDHVNHPFLEKLSSSIGRERTIVAIDAIRGEIVTEGWRHRTGLSLHDAVDEIEDYCSEFLFTCVENEGTMKSIDKKIIKKLLGMTHRRIVVAGGVASIDEIGELANMGVDVQLGMALYTGKIKLEEGFIESLNWKRNLIPAITQDVSGQVLMMGYVSRDSLKKTFDESRMWYYSRSKGRLWMKGETSGNVQEVLRMRTDCDGDTLLATVRQKGGTCHKGSYSCFGERRFSLRELFDVIKDRIENPPPGSYTAQLTDNILKDKLLEEVREIIEAKGKEEIIWEASDVIYFLTVFLARNSIDMEDVLFELRRRRNK